MIRQFDVFPNPSRHGTKERPFIVSVQAALLNDFKNRVCVALIAKECLRPIARLNPLVRVGARELYFHPAEIASVPIRLLRAPVANLARERDKIIAALDLVFTGI
jgi:toxin CcdB